MIGIQLKIMLIFLHSLNDKFEIPVLRKLGFNQNQNFLSVIIKNKTVIEEFIRLAKKFSNKTAIKTEHEQSSYSKILSTGNN